MELTYDGITFDNLFEMFERVVYKSDLETFKKMVDELDDINITNKYGWTLLHITIRRDERDMVAYLLDKGANIDQKDGAGWTPLMEAIMDDKPELCKYLVDKGADKSIPNDRGATAPMLAQKFGRSSMYQYLM